MCFVVGLFSWTIWLDYLVGLFSWALTVELGRYAGLAGADQPGDLHVTEKHPTILGSLGGNANVFTQHSQ